MQDLHDCFQEPSQQHAPAVFNESFVNEQLPQPTKLRPKRAGRENEFDLFNAMRDEEEIEEAPESSKADSTDSFR